MFAFLPVTHFTLFIGPCRFLHAVLVQNIIWLYLSQGKQLGALLDEDPALMEKRLQCAKRLELYKSARDEIDSVAWVR